MPERWEYHFEYSADPKQFNKLGLEGWKLVVGTSESELFETILIFIRPLVVPNPVRLEPEDRN